MIFVGPATAILFDGGQFICNTFSQRNLQYLKRFTVFCDKRFKWQPQTVVFNRTTVAAESTPNITEPAYMEGPFIEKLFSSVLNLPIEYSAFTAGTNPIIINVKSNNIFGFLLIDSGFAIASSITFGAESLTRICFFDV